MFFDFADEEFDEQQPAQRKTRGVHAGDGPRLGGAKRPRTEDQHGQNQPAAQIIAKAIQLNVERAQSEKRLRQWMPPGSDPARLMVIDALKFVHPGSRTQPGK